MDNSWFRWERQASIHLLFPTLEVFYQPLESYSKVVAPTMILVFERGVVTWCIKESEFVEYGNNLLQLYCDPNKERKMVSDIKKSLSLLKMIEEKMDGLTLSKLSDHELADIHHKLYHAFLNYYTMGAIGTPLSFSAEIILKNKGLSDDVINSLATPDEISYVVEADQHLLQTKNTKSFIDKYFWIDNNYSGTKRINAIDVKKRLNFLKDKSATKMVHGQSVVKLDKESKRLIELLKHYSVYKDNRKKEILIYLHYIDSILKEVSRRTGLTIDQVRASLPSEVSNLLSGRLTKDKLNKRLDYSVIVWQKSKKKPQILMGSKGKEWEEKTLLKTSLGGIIQGRTACPGKVTGKVRILLKAEDCNQLKQGEVLVTFMTSPDFMRAIRKCSAIVTNLGGVTSHAAIISRELNIPCIVGTKTATKFLKDGDLIEVDADNGIVRVLNR